MGNIYTVIENFMSGPRFARLYINNIATPVEVTYLNDKLEISNLEEYHKFIQIPINGNTQIKKSYYWKSLASTNRENWKPLSEEESQWLQLYRLWDPIFFLSKYTDFKREFPFKSNQLYTISGSYSTANYDFPAEIREIFFKHSEVIREFEIYLRNNTILA
jgi:hypothetical protein